MKEITGSLIRKVRHEYRRALAFMLAFVVFFTNVGSNVSITLAANAVPAITALFKLSGEDMLEAAQEAVDEGQIFDPSTLELTTKDATLMSKYERLFGDGSVYEIFPDMEDGAVPAGTELRTFICVDEMDEDYRITGDEQIIFLFINGSDQRVQFYADVDGYVTYKVTVDGHLSALQTPSNAAPVPGAEEETAGAGEVTEQETEAEQETSEAAEGTHEGTTKPENGTEASKGSAEQASEPETTAASPENGTEPETAGEVSGEVSEAASEEMTEAETTAEASKEEAGQETKAVTEEKASELETTEATEEAAEPETTTEAETEAEAPEKEDVPDDAADGDLTASISRKAVGLVTAPGTGDTDDKSDEAIVEEEDEKEKKTEAAETKTAELKKEETKAAETKAEDIEAEGTKPETEVKAEADKATSAAEADAADTEDTADAAETKAEVSEKTEPGDPAGESTGEPTETVGSADTGKDSDKGSNTIVSAPPISQKETTAASDDEEEWFIPEDKDYYDGIELIDDVTPEEEKQEENAGGTIKGTTYNQVELGEEAYARAFVTTFKALHVDADKLPEEIVADDNAYSLEITHVLTYKGVEYVSYDSVDLNPEDFDDEGNYQYDSFILEREGLRTINQDTLINKMSFVSNGSEKALYASEEIQYELEDGYTVWNSQKSLKTAYQRSSRPRVNLNDVEIIPIESIHTLTINYFYAFEEHSSVSGKVAAQPHIETLPVGTTYSVVSPEILGYTPDRVSVSGAMGEEDIDIDVLYYASDNVKYVVKHFYQNLDGRYPNTPEVANMTGKTGEYTKAEVIEREGFTSKSFVQSEIAADGSTEVEIYYDRDKHYVYFNTGEGSYVDAVEAMYGASVIVSDKKSTRPGYSMSGNWYTDSDCTQAAGSSVTMGTEDITLYAKWIPKQVEYKVVFWKEKVDGSGYDYVSEDTVSRNATVNTKVDAQKADQSKYSKDGFRFEKSVPVVVKGDGTSILNVYYLRNEYTMKWIIKQGKKDNIVKEITRKVGTKIYNEWPDGDYKGYGWYLNLNDTAFYIAMEEMPVGGKTFYGKKGGAYNYRHYYLVESLDSHGLDSWDTYKIDEFTYQKSNLHLVESDCHPITGFTWIEDKQNYNYINNRGYYEAKIYYSRNTSKIDFDSLGGTPTLKSITAKYEAPVSKPTTTPTREGYTFGGWYDNEWCEGNEFVFSKMPPTDIRLYAKWIPKKYDVTFYYQDGVTSNYVEKVDYKALATEPEEPEREGYTFGGWYSNAWTTGSRYNFSKPVESHLGLYAKWIPSTEASYTVKYVQDNSGETELFDPKTVEKQTVGTTVTEYAIVEDSLLCAPDAVSKSIVIAPKDNVIYFRYTPFETLSYRVEYRDESGNRLRDDKVVTDCAKARITEEYVNIPGYTPKEYQIVKTLVNEVAEADIQNNVIVFTYEKNLTNQYVVEHYLEQQDGEYKLEKSIKSADSIGKLIKAEPIDTGAMHVLNLKHPATKAEGVITSNQVLTLKLYYDLRNINIIYHANGGEGGPVSIPVKYGKDARISENHFVAPNSYEFVEWNTQSDGQGDSYKPADTISGVTADISLYAQWKKIEIPVQVWFYVKDDDTAPYRIIEGELNKDNPIAAADFDNILSVGEQIPYNTNQIKQFAERAIQVLKGTAGYEDRVLKFQSYEVYTVKDGHWNSLNSDYRVEAKDAIRYHVLFDYAHKVVYIPGEHGTGEKVTDSKRYYSRENVGVMTAEDAKMVPDEGYVFAGWEPVKPSNIKIESDTFKMPAEDVTLKATFKLENYKVTTSSDENSTIDSGNEYTYSSTEESQIKFSANPGYYIDSITVDDNVLKENEKLAAIAAGYVTVDHKGNHSVSVTASKRTDLKYEVHYYYDGIEDVDGSVKASGMFGDDIQYTADRTSSYN